LEKGVSANIFPSKESDGGAVDSICDEFKDTDTGAVVEVERKKKADAEQKITMLQLWFQK
jgi:hypothetical protein